MNEFIWQNSYQLGHQKVDEQHQQLFDLANQLVESTNQHALAENAMRLYRHVREHFKAEEAFMKERDYPNYESHVATHNLMLNKLVDVSDKINRHEWQQQDVLKFMKEWITHILHEDSTINEYFHAQQHQPTAKK